jgi:hypothetical protein
MAHWVLGPAYKEPYKRMETVHYSILERSAIVHLRQGFSPFLQEGPIVYGAQRVDGALLFAHLLHYKSAKMD